MLNVLETDRLILRPMTLDDAAIIVKWRNSTHVAKMSHASRTTPITVQEHVDWFTKTRNQRIDYVIQAKSSFTPIGSVSFTWRKLKSDFRCAESGRYLGEHSVLGLGYGYESAKCWMDFGFQKLRLDCIFSRTRADNLANLKINQKLGLQAFDWPTELESYGPEWIFMKIDRPTYLNGGGK